ncbi:hypothetical protein ACO0SA_003696 [Hanseniaspora valbyensis]
MPEPTLEHTLLVTQELGFSYEKHVQDYLSIINKLVYECSNVFKQHLINFMQVDQDIITESIYNLEEKIEEIIDKAISDHESYCMRSIFNLPENTDLRLFRLSTQLNYKLISENKFEELKNKVKQETCLVEINLNKIKKLKQFLKEINVIISRLDKLLIAYKKLAALQMLEKETPGNTNDYSWLLSTLNNAKEKTFTLQTGILNIIKMNNNPFFIDQLNNVI